MNDPSDPHFFYLGKLMAQFENNQDVHGYDTEAISIAIEPYVRDLSTLNLWATLADVRRLLRHPETGLSGIIERQFRPKLAVMAWGTPPQEWLGLIEAALVTSTRQRPPAPGDFAPTGHREASS